VRFPFTVDSKLSGDSRLTYAVTQLLAGPPVARDAVVLFPQGTTATVTQRGSAAVVNLKGVIERSFQGGETDETGMFKSLTYTLTAFPGITKVQVLVGGRTVAALPGGAFELDEPLTRSMFAQ
jgi:spore germination protein GerM